MILRTSENKLPVHSTASYSTGNECSLHQIAPYIGKIKSSIAQGFLQEFGSDGIRVWDPFCGSGSVALEAWRAGCRVVANDLNPYSVTITQAKLYPPRNLEVALTQIDRLNIAVSEIQKDFDLRKVPPWVRSFFHPETLRETLAWFTILAREPSPFLTACLLGILHHQRPGFLSFPSSHAVPYLREKKYPRESFPEMYEYRTVKDRLERKVTRTFRAIGPLDRSVARRCLLRDSAEFIARGVDLIVTSPPYMGQLDYARDNRLRLWFLGVLDYRPLDHKISPSENDFLNIIRKCFRNWHSALTPGGHCVLVLGDSRVKTYGLPLPDAIIEIATKEIGGYSLAARSADPIPEIRRVRRGLSGSLTETTIVLRKEK